MPALADHAPLRSRTQQAAATSIALRDCGVCAVRATSICSALPDSEHGRFTTLGRRVSLRPRAVLFSEGAVAEAVYNVTEGVVRLHRLLPDGARRVIGFGMPGDFLGLPTDERHSFTADALEPVTVCRFSRRAFSAFMEDRPTFVRRVLNSTTDTLDLARDHMVLLARPDARTKVAAFLLAMRARSARLRPPSVTVHLPMGRQDIGDFLGLSIATVSRTLTRLARQRVILIIPNGVRILDLRALERIAGA